MILIADSGSTKTDWRVVSEGRVIQTVTTQGINPFHQSVDYIHDVINNELITSMNDKQSISEIVFYGAGCIGDKCGLLKQQLSDSFPHVNIDVNSDLLAAARSLCGSKEGVACILGTGSNSCLYDGRNITSNVSPMGYILGDEGSGAVLGKLFVNELYKGNISGAIREEFEKDTGLTLQAIIENVYRKPMANRFLASLAPFISTHIDNPVIESLVITNFRNFLTRNVLHYNRTDLAVNAVGSIAYHFAEQLEKAIMEVGMKVGKICKSPMEGLVMYHSL